MGRVRHPNHRPVSTLPPELRRTVVPEPVRRWVQHHTGSAVVQSKRLAGASSAAIHRLRLDDGRRVVLRRYVWRAFIEAEPEAPQREAELLHFALRNGLRVPELLAADPSGGEVGDGVPVLLMTLLAGQPRADADPNRLAEAAAQIHEVDAAELGHQYFPWYEEEMTTPPIRTQQPDLWEQAIDLWRNVVPAHEPVLIHRDFHPGNVLWSRGVMTGLVDWANGCRGPAGCDVATCRSNLVEWAGPVAADAFVSAYESITGQTLHPFWPMANLLEAGPSHWTPANLARREPELARLVSLLS